MIESTAPPDALVDENNRVRMGVFNGPVRNVNLEDARVRSGRFLLSRRLSRWRLKEWQHYAIILPEAMVSFAIVDAKFLKTTWCHVVIRAADEHFEHARQSPFLAARIARELFDDQTSVRARGYRIDVDNRLDAGEHRIRIAIAEGRSRPAVEAHLTCLHELAAIQPLVVVLPVGRGRGMYSHKVPLPVTGTIRVGERTFRATPQDSVAILDIHKAHYPRHTFWNWATCAGWDSAGRLIGLNLTRNVNEDDGRFNENAIWVDGRLAHLGPARFELDRRALLEPWRLTTADGAADVEFRPQGERAQRVRLGVVSSVFSQPYGTFRGVVRVGPERVEIEDLFGVCEDHRAVW